MKRRDEDKKDRLDEKSKKIKREYRSISPENSFELNDAEKDYGLEKSLSCLSDSVYVFDFFSVKSLGMMDKIYTLILLNICIFTLGRGKAGRVDEVDKSGYVAAYKNKDTYDKVHGKH
uniref:Uncharacterized protein n=1 Tax=Heterorhabditis bacteriophora TaxID=37862 RepID=A0A1I7XMQ1_HETBA